MNYELLLYLCPIAGVAGLAFDAFICMIIQETYELKGKGTPNVEPLFAVLIFPCWIIIWIVSYMIFNT